MLKDQVLKVVESGGKFQVVFGDRVMVTLNPFKSFDEALVHALAMKYTESVPEGFAKAASVLQMLRIGDPEAEHYLLEAQIDITPYFWSDPPENLKGRDFYVVTFDREKQNRVAVSRDEAWLDALCVKYDGVNTQGTKFLARLLGMTDSAWY